ncbi:hypothetical protein ACH5RR_009008 [Cinchona calisaya]|uniref:Uncharacterized protein n=1 Tax=Cinchona calisaya TaxID=153742 RepID=A0ABD3AD37_9GENT
MATNLETKVDKFSRDFIISSFRAIVKLMTSSDLSEIFDLAGKISSWEKFVKDVDCEDVENLSLKFFDHLKNFQDLNSQLHDSSEQLQEFENWKAVLLKKEAKMQAKKL